MSDSKLKCSACGQTTEDGLVLMPSGRNFKRHPGQDGERCTGGQPQSIDPEPVAVVARKVGEATECVECGESQPALKTPGKVRKHTNSQTLAPCQQRETVEAQCPVCESNRILRKLRLPNHKDPKTNTRCPASNKTLPEAQVLDKVAPPPKGDKAPKVVSVYKTLSPLDKSRFKAKKLGDELALLDPPWRYRVLSGQDDQDADQATLVARRGRGADQEEFRISWWGGACLGGENRITHLYRGRLTAVRNANAIRLKAERSPEAVAGEFNRIASRKVHAPRKKKSPEQLREVMAFDPKTASDEAILKAVLGRTVKWERTIDGKIDDDVVKKAPRITNGKSGRTLNFQGKNTTRSVLIEKLVSVS